MLGMQGIFLVSTEFCFSQILKRLLSINLISIPRGRLMVNTYKVFGIGLNKTGTKTLAAALKHLGFRQHISVRRDLLALYRRGYVEDIFKVIEDNEIFEDWPFPLMYREIYYRYGNNARFVLTKRKSSNAWLDSLKQHSLRTPPDEQCRLLAYGYNYPHGLEQYHIKFYEMHNENVTQFFNQHNSSSLLLEASWDSGDGWSKLCSFLNVQIPDIAFPHKNKGLEIKNDMGIESENLARIQQQLCNLHLKP